MGIVGLEDANWKRMRVISVVPRDVEPLWLSVGNWELANGLRVLKDVGPSCVEDGFNGQLLSCYL